MELRAGGSSSSSVGAWSGGAFGWVGSAHNIDELAGACGLDGEACLGQVLKAGIEQFGGRFLERLEGPIAAVVADQRLRLVRWRRDRFGHVPTQYRLTERQGLWIGTELLDLYDSRQRQLEQNPSRLASHLAFAWDDAGEEDFLVGVSRLKPAHELRVHVGRRLETTASRYWNPTHEDTAKSGKTWLEEMRQALRINLQSTAGRGGRVAIALSSGLDSGLLAAIMARMPNLNPVAATKSFPSYPEFDESVAAARLASELGLEHHQIELESDEPTDALLEAPQSFWGLGPYFHPGETYETIFLERARDITGATAIVGGHGGEFAVQARGIRRRDPLLNMVDALPLSSGEVLRQFIEKGFDSYWELRSRQQILHRLNYGFMPFDLLLGFLYPSVLVSVLRKYTSPTGPLEGWSYEMSRRMAWRKYVRTGLVRHSPYLSKRVFELGINVPPELCTSFQESDYRPVMRRLCNGLLPEDLCSKPKHGLFCPFVRAKMEAQERKLLDLAWDAYSTSPVVERLLDYRSLSDFISRYLKASRQSRTRQLPGSLILWLPLAAMAWSRGSNHTPQCMS
ncbi:asparagine synthase-related protein [Persicimonas caeni]|uniref:asparagine synthase-related protein n=1 Tax=Persicimonas caeni TaxID=2292766 RepID=UPI00143DA60A|nr:asparagine synthetase B family protein [Persicimonas caeni]